MGEVQTNEAIVEEAGVVMQKEKKGTLRMELGAMGAGGRPTYQRLAEAVGLGAGKAAGCLEERGPTAP